VTKDNIIDTLRPTIGTHSGYSSWHAITQEQINLFAEATGDRQWIHTDPDRAANGPFGTTVAHGYLTLSLVPMLMSEALALEGVTTAINYGSNKVRFPTFTPVDSRVRGGFELLEVTETANGVQCVHRVTVERDGSDKPVCVAEVVSLLIS
jgi:acyl dehydratase